MSTSRLVNSRRVILLQSIITLLFGTLLLLFPERTARAVVVFISIYLIMDGGSTLLSKAGEKSNLALALGALAVIIGVITLVNPGWLGLSPVFFLAGWVLIHGLLNAGEFVASRPNRRLASWLGLTVVVLMTLGVWLVSHVGSGAFMLIRWIGIFGVIYGYTLLGLSFELRRVADKPVSEGVRSAESKKAA